MGSIRRLAEITDSLVDDRVGVLQYVEELAPEPGAPRFFHYYARACNTRAFALHANFANAGGAAATRESALAKAVGEAVERYCSAIYELDGLPLRPRLEAPFQTVDPGRFALYTPRQYESPGFPFVPFDDDSPVRWAPTTDPLTGETWYVPAASVYMPYLYYAGDGDSPILQPISTGLACHASAPEAAVSGLCEVIERDAFMITWQARLAPPRLAVDSLSEANYQLVRRFEKTGAAVSLFDLATDVGVSTVLSVLRGPSPATPAMVFATSTSLDPEEAVRKSLEELAHTRRYMQQVVDHLPRLVPDPPAHDNIVDQLTHLNFWCDPANAHLADFLFESGDRIDFDELPRLATGDPWDDVALLCEKVRDTGFQALVVDLTTPDIESLGLSVVRAVVPGFHPLCMGHRLRALGGTRLWQVPRTLGYKNVSPENGDNPTPHPFP
jgi:ribosomal protein S12 methylthiotransferase accessory factor